MEDASSEITSLLAAVGNGDEDAAERLWRAVYDELHRVAEARLAHSVRRDDLQTTVLVQEAYVRLVGGDRLGRIQGSVGDRAQAHAAAFANRRHFFAAAAKAMRQFLVDDARRRGRLKRGGGRQPWEFREAAAAFDGDPADVLALDEALAKLRAHDIRKAEIVQLRYFVGLTIDETADMLGLSARQVDKEWRFAKAWLHHQLS